MNKIIKGDEVICIAGRDKGKRGTVKEVCSGKRKGRLVVEGINMVTKHQKPTQQQEGQKLRIEAAIHRSNIMIFNPNTQKRDRVRILVDEQGKKRRVYASTGEDIKKA